MRPAEESSSEAACFYLNLAIIGKLIVALISEPTFPRFKEWPATSADSQCHSQGICFAQSHQRVFSSTFASLYFYKNYMHQEIIVPPMSPGNPELPVVVTTDRSPLVAQDNWSSRKSAEALHFNACCPTNMAERSAGRRSTIIPTVAKCWHHSSSPSLSDAAPQELCAGEYSRHDQVDQLETNVQCGVAMHNLATAHS